MLLWPANRLRSRVKSAVSSAGLLLLLSACGGAQFSTAQAPVPTSSSLGNPPMSEPAILIVNAVVNPAETAALEQYSTQATALFKAAGATPLGRYRLVEPVLGDRHPTLVVMMEFPSDQAIREVFASEAYQQLTPEREKAFETLDVFITH